jgi:hypothetical protein
MKKVNITNSIANKMVFLNWDVEDIKTQLLNDYPNSKIEITDADEHFVYIAIDNEKFVMNDIGEVIEQTWN